MQRQFQPFNSEVVKKGKAVCLESRYPCNYMFLGFTSPGSGRLLVSNYRPNFGSVHQVPIMATKAVWNMKFGQHLYIWPALGIEPQTWFLSPMSYPLGRMLPLLIACAG